jgi:hypothetical protein
MSVCAGTASFSRLWPKELGSFVDALQPFVYRRMYSVGPFAEGRRFIEIWACGNELEDSLREKTGLAFPLDRACVFDFVGYTGFYYRV